MFLFQNRHAAVFLLAITQSLVFASFENEKNQAKLMAEMIRSFMQVPWIDRIDSVIHPSESSCAMEFTALMEAIKSGEMWALQMLDASSKIQSGILRGNTRDLGMYNECVEVNGQYNDTKIRGKHCTISISTVPKKSRTLISSVTEVYSSSLCVPASCNETQIDKIINAILESSSITNQFGLEPSETSCVEVESEEFTMGEILTMALFSTVGAFILSCTICDLVKRSRPGDMSVIVKELTNFSLITNATALLSTKSKPNTIPAIQGIRFLSMCWVVLGHRYFNSMLKPMVNFVEIRDWYNSWTAVYVQAAPFAVDTFFVISGFLMAYLFLKSKQSGDRFNVLIMYLHRYLRLTPCLAVLLLFVTFLLHRFVKGLARKTLYTEMIDSCEKNWWVNLFYVQNFVRVDESCLSYTWYLAVDMQLFSISPIILYPLHRWPKYGLGILSFLLFASIITPAVLLAVNGYSNALVRLDMTKERLWHGFRENYIPTYNRACAYFVGVLMGYDVANKKRHLSQVNVAINWVVTCILMLFCGWATHQIYNSDFPYDIVLESGFAVLLRPFWSISIAWIVYACIQGYGGFVTSFLSLPLFLPLSRLSYCVYLVHVVIQTVRIVEAQTPGSFVNFEFFNDFWSDLVLSIAVAFIFSLFFESPVIVLEKMIIKRGRKLETSIPGQKPKKDLEMGIENKAMTKD